MHTPIYTRQFERDLKRLRNRRKNIQADWLLVYKIEGDSIIFERSGSHSDLFS